ncbi:hypothetical protein D3C77_757040 [compost metagenome]
MSVSGVIGNQDLGNASDVRCSFSYTPHVLACDQHVDVATDPGGSSHRVQGGRGYGSVFPTL